MGFIHRQLIPAACRTPLCRRQQSVFDGIYSRLEGQLAAAREQSAALQEAASAAEAAHGQAEAEVASLQAQGDAEQVRQPEHN